MLSYYSLAAISDDLRNLIGLFEVLCFRTDLSDIPLRPYVCKPVRTIGLKRHDYITTKQRACAFVPVIRVGRLYQCLCLPVASFFAFSVASKIVAPIMYTSLNSSPLVITFLRPGLAT